MFSQKKGKKDIHDDQKIMSIKTEHLNPQDPEFDVLCVSHAAEVQIVNWPNFPGYSGVLPREGLTEKERERVEAMMNDKFGDGKWRLEQTGLLPFFLEQKSLPVDVREKYKDFPEIAVPHAYQASNQCESIFHGKEGEKRKCSGRLVVLRVKLQIER